MKSGVIVVLLASVASSAFVSFAVLGSVSELPLTIFIYFASFMAIYLAYSIHKKKALDKEIIDDIMKGIAKASNYKSAKIPLPRALDKASRFSRNKSASEILLKASARIKMGESLLDSLVLSAKDRKIGKEIARYFGAGSSVGESALLYERMEKKRSARSSALATRHATLGMFVSTIAPSFAIFSFIGGIMVSPADSGLFLLSISLTAAIPVAYAAINILSERSLN